MAPETSVISDQLTWLIAREYFINFRRRESFVYLITDYVSQRVTARHDCKQYS
jgi:hypothetical protein